MSPSLCDGESFPFSYSAMGLDVALEEINHLLEVDLTDNPRPRLSSGGRISSDIIRFISAFEGTTSEERTQDNLYQPPANEEVL